MTPAEAMMNTVEWEVIELDANMLANDGIPYATHEGILNIGGFDFKCYQLSDGRRVFDAESVHRFFGSLTS
jgi:hypothetical protein